MCRDWCRFEHNYHLHSHWVGILYLISFRMVFSTVHLDNAIQCKKYEAASVIQDSKRIFLSMKIVK